MGQGWLALRYTEHKLILPFDGKNKPFDAKHLIESDST